MKYIAVSLVIFSGCFLWAAGTGFATLAYTNSGRIADAHWAINGGIAVTLLGMVGFFVTILRNPGQP